MEQGLRVHTETRTMLWKPQLKLLEILAEALLLLNPSGMVFLLQESKCGVRRSRPVGRSLNQVTPPHVATGRNIPAYTSAQEVNSRLLQTTLAETGCLGSASALMTTDLGPKSFSVSFHPSTKQMERKSPAFVPIPQGDYKCMHVLMHAGHVHTQRLPLPTSPLCATFTSTGDLC